MGEHTLDAKKQSERKLFELRRKLHALKKKLKNKNYLNLLDPKELNEWNGDMVIEWIVSLENGRYLKYESSLFLLFERDNMNGMSLINEKLTESELRNAGINRFCDRKELMQHIVELIEHYNELKELYHDKMDENDVEEKEESKSVNSDVLEVKEPGNELNNVPISVLNEIEGSVDEINQNLDDRKEPGSINRIDAHSEVSEAESIVIHDEDDSKENKEQQNVVNKLEKYKIKSVPKWFDNLSKRALSAELKIECNECYELKLKEQGYADKIDGICIA